MAGRDLTVRYLGDTGGLQRSNARAKSEISNTLTAAQRLEQRYAASVMASSRSVKTAKAAEEAATRKLRIEELRMQEARDSGTASASKLAQAQDRVIRAQTGLQRAQERSQGATAKLTDAQQRQAAALQRTDTVARGFGPRLRAALAAGPREAGRVGQQIGQRLSSGVKGGLSRLGGLAKAGVAGLAVGVLGAGYAAVRGFSAVIKAAGDAEQSVGAVQAVFGKYAQGVQRDSRAAAGAVGISANAYRELASTLGSTLKNKGIQDFAGQTKGLIRLGADLSAQYGGSTKEAVEALGSALRGETDPIERYGVSLNQAAIQQEGIRLGLVRGKGALTDQQKAVAALSLVQRQTASAQGAFGRETDTYAHKVQVAAARFEDLKVSIGNKFLPIATQAMGFVSDTAIPAISKWVGETKGLGPVVDQLIPLVGGLGRVAGAGFGGAAGGGLRAYTKGVRGLFDYLATHQADIVDGLRTGGNAALDLGQALVDGAANGLRGVGALADGVAGFVQSSTDAVGGLIRSAAAIAPLLGPAGVPIAKAAADFDKAQASADGVAAGLRRAGAGAKDAGDNLDQTLTPALQRARDKMNATADAEIVKARQRDAAASFAVAVRDMGTNAAGAQIHLKTWADRVSLGGAASRALEKRVKGAGNALQEQIGAQQAAGAGQKALSATWTEGRNRLAAEFRQMGLSKKEARRLADSYAGVKPKVSTKFETPGLGDAKRVVDQLARSVANLPTQKTISIYTKTYTSKQQAAGNGPTKSATGGVWMSGGWGSGGRILRRATGGVLPGYTPGRDVHRFVSPTGGVLDLSGGEAIMRPEFTRLVGGPRTIERWNRDAEAGHLGQKFAGGGTYLPLPASPQPGTTQTATAPSSTLSQAQVDQLAAALRDAVEGLGVEIVADSRGISGLIQAAVRDELRKRKTP